MRHRFSYIGSVLAILAGMGWWGNSVSRESSRDRNQESTVSKQDRSSQRIELIETLDQIIELQNEYRATTGRYTQHLGRLGFDIPPWVRDAYEVRVVEASEDSLLLVARAEGGDVSADSVSIDQNFKVRANFLLPPPRLEFLRSKALRHLKHLKDQASHSADPLLTGETGVFAGYFEYQTRVDPSATRVVVQALGVKEPVVGLRFELSGPKIEKHSVLNLSPHVLSDSIENRVPKKELDGIPGPYAKSGLELIDFAQILFSSFSKPNRELGSVNGEETQNQNRNKILKPKLYRSDPGPKLEIEPIASHERK